MLTCENCAYYTEYDFIEPVEIEGQVSETFLMCEKESEFFGEVNAPKNCEFFFPVNVCENNTV